MTIKRSIFLLLFLIYGAGNIVAQDIEPEQDTLYLDFDAFISMVKEQHPFARQAQIEVEQADAALMMARGAFDPVLMSDYARKNFDSKNYYQIINAGVKIPTWFGVDIYGGIDKAQGDFLNPENNTTQNGLWYGGLSVPIGKNLIIDRRRAVLNKAKINRQSSVAQQKLLMNNLLLEAGNAYWDWFMAYHINDVYKEAVEVSKERLEAVKQNAEIGESPYIDTVEASIQYQNRQLGQQESELKYKNATAYLSVFLWMEGYIPLELNNTSLPPAVDSVRALGIDGQLISRLDSVEQIHPRILQYQYTLDKLKIDQRFGRDQLKPQIDLKYNFLNDLIGANELENYSVNNYKIGVDFSFPLFLRQQRGALKRTNLEIEANSLGLSTSLANLTFKAKASLNKWNTTKQQYDLYVNTVRDYESLLQAEQQLFFAGESSLFLVNAREQGFIDSRTKMIQLLSDNRKSILKTYYSFGDLSDRF